MTTSVLYQRNELFTSDDDLADLRQRATGQRDLAPQRLFNAPIYASANASTRSSRTARSATASWSADNGYSRLDVAPTVRVPLSRLTFLSVNTSAAYRTTYYSHSANLTGSGTVDQPYLRQYTTLRSEVVGPVFNRSGICQSGFAERLKHVIEPAFTVDFTSHIDNYKRTPSIGSDVADFVVSGSTRVTYGLTNRLFARGRTVDNVRGTTREFVTVGLQQTYYTNPQAGRLRQLLPERLAGRKPTDLSPLALTTRVCTDSR